MQANVRRALVVGLFVAVLGVACASPVPVGEDAGIEGRPPTVIYLMRHGEATYPPYEEESPNPRLNEAGQARAAALVAVLGAEAIDTIFSTDLHRTQETAAPLAAHLGLQVQSYDPFDPEFAARLRTLVGRHVVVGHSNTTPAVVEALGGVAGPPIDSETEFDRLYVVFIDGDEVTTLHLRYGETSETLEAAGSY